MSHGNPCAWRLATCDTLEQTETRHQLIMKKRGKVATARTPFEKLTAIHPNRRITLETGPIPLATRLMDMFVPLGFGQRALIVAPPQAGKTTILRQIAAAT